MNAWNLQKNVRTKYGVLCKMESKYSFMLQHNKPLIYSYVWRSEASCLEFGVKTVDSVKVQVQTW